MFELIGNYFNVLFSWVFDVFYYFMLGLGIGTIIVFPLKMFLKKKTSFYNEKPFNPENITPTKEEKRDPWFLINNLKH